MCCLYFLTQTGQIYIRGALSAVFLLLSSTWTIPISSSLTNFNCGTLISLNSMPVLCNISSVVIKPSGTISVLVKKVKLFQITFINHKIFVYIIFYFSIAACHLSVFLNLFLRVFLP